MKIETWWLTLVSYYFMNNYSTELIALKVLTSERSGKIEFSFPGPVLGLFYLFPLLFPLPLTRFPTDKSLWSSKYDVLISWCILNFFFFGGGGGRWTGSWADWVHSIYVCTHSNLFWRCLSYWLGKGIPVTNLIDLTHANWNEPYVVKPTLPTSWLASKNA